MGGTEKRRTLFVLRRSPYGSSLAKSSIDVALAAAAFEQPIDLLFMGEGVLQLHRDQDSRPLGVKNIGRQLAALPLFDISRVYVDSAAVARYNMNLSELAFETDALKPAEVHQLLLGYDHLLGF